MEQFNYNLLSGWFVGLEIDDGVWDHAVFSKNRDRRLNQDLAQKFFAHVKHQAAGLMPDEHFTVDGMLLEAWAGQNSFRRVDLVVSTRTSQAYGSGDRACNHKALLTVRFPATSLSSLNFLRRKPCAPLRPGEAPCDRRGASRRGGVFAAGRKTIASNARPIPVPVGKVCRDDS